MQDVLLAGRFVLGALLTFAGLSKQLHRAAFRQAISRYRLVPARFVPSLAAFLSISESSLGVGLLIGIALIPVAFLSAALLLAFTTAVWFALARGERIPCGCFGSDTSTLISRGTAVRNVALTLSAAIVGASALIRDVGFWAPFTSPGGDSVRGGELAAIAVAVCLALSLWQLSGAALEYARVSRTFTLRGSAEDG
jgi:Methylamine utilisation protein MauE